MVSARYDDARFKETLRVSRGTFLYILDAIRPDLERESVGGSPLSPELRLGICLYRLARGDYYYTIAEMAGIGEATVCTTVIEVCHLYLITCGLQRLQVSFQKQKMSSERQ